LDAWQGVWIEQLVSSKSLYIEFAPSCMMDGGPPEVPEEYRGMESDDNWLMNLTVSTIDGEFSDVNNKLGIDGNAVDGYDFLDAIEFTPMGDDGWVQLYFEHPEWGMQTSKFTFDFRNTDFSGGDKYWDFTARCYLISGCDFKLSWSDLTGIPSEYQLYLDCPEDNVTLLDMRTANQYVFTFSDTGAYPIKTFRIRVEQNPFGGDDLLNLHFGFKGIYPNPFNNQVRISYDLPETEEISLKVFNIFGQEVAILKEGLATAGEHSQLWDTEGKLASGVYLVQLRSSSETKVQKAVMIR
jgi:hypothetical protein